MLARRDSSESHGREHAAGNRTAGDRELDPPRMAVYRRRAGLRLLCGKRTCAADLDVAAEPLVEAQDDAR